MADTLNPETDLTIRITEEALSRFQNNLGKVVTRIDIARDAITLFTWAAEQRAAGRELVSYDPISGELRQLAIPSLDSEANKPH